MARVPVSGSFKIEGDTTGASSTGILNVLRHVNGSFSGNSLKDAIDFIKDNYSIENLDPQFRPSSLSNLSKASQLRGFPIEDVFSEYTIDYDWSVLPSVNPPFNSPSVSVDGILVNTTDNTYSNRSGDLAISANYTVASGDLSNANPFYLNVFVGTSIGGSQIDSFSVNRTTTGTLSISETITESQISSAISNGGTVYVRVQLSDVGTI